jgi:hypothetical protein
MDDYDKIVDTTSKELDEIRLMQVRAGIIK